MHKRTIINIEDEQYVLLDRDDYMHIELCVVYGEMSPFTGGPDDDISVEHEILGKLSEGKLGKTNTAINQALANFLRKTAEQISANDEVPNWISLSVNGAS